MKILITGSAGFIGFHLTDRLLGEGHEVVGIDVINDYYDTGIKFARLRRHGIEAEDMELGSSRQSTMDNGYRFHKVDLADHESIVEFMVQEKFECVVHLAAQAGVRHSISHPRDYTHNNIDAFLSILEGCRYSEVGHLIYASTSSVYGLNEEMPFREDRPVDHPMALYAATKKANELMAHSYSHLFRIPTTGLRFFTVYGPWGRPDMALMLFTKAIIDQVPIKLFNHGKMLRDFTYVSDIVESIQRLIARPAKPNMDWNPLRPSSDASSAPYQIFNIGNSDPVPLKDYISALEQELQMEALKDYVDMQPGDIPASFADSSKLEAYTGFKPSTDVKDGIRKFVEWYRSYYQ